MRTEQSIFSVRKGWDVIGAHELGSLAQLVLVFGDRELLLDQEKINHIRHSYPVAEIVGCSTAGAIQGEEIKNDSISCTAIYFEKSSIKVICERIESMDQSFMLGQKIIDRIEKDKLKHVFILCDGLMVNGSRLTKGLNSRLDGKASVTGGLAGDQDLFQETVIVHNNEVMKGLLLAVAYYGDQLEVGYGSMGGWSSFGVDRLVTKSKDNVLYELDNQPALALYKKYLGEYASSLPSSAMLFPLSFDSKTSQIPIVRTVLSVNEADGSIGFAGDIPEGEHVRLMKTSFEKLYEGAWGAAEMSLKSMQDVYPDLAILISCVGRRLVLKQRVEQELDCVREVLEKDTMITGFYSYGEICPVQPEDHQCELLNQTMTITLFKEV